MLQLAPRTGMFVWTTGDAPRGAAGPGKPRRLGTGEDFLQASHRYEERRSGCRAKIARVFGSADKSREEKMQISSECAQQSFVQAH